MVWDLGTMGIPFNANDDSTNKYLQQPQFWIANEVAVGKGCSYYAFIDQNKLSLGSDKCFKYGLVT